LDRDHPITGEQLARMGRFLTKETGLAFGPSKQGILASCISSHLAERGLATFEELWELLHDSARVGNELQLLLQAVTTGETFFFRHSAQFELFRERVLPALVKAHSTNRTLRIWSAGCATGEEAYTVAILLKEHLPFFGSWKIEILGTDINQAFLEVARRGVYQRRAVKEMSAPLVGRYFEAHAEGLALKDSIRSMVAFRYHNLVSTAWPIWLTRPQSWDIILARNVLMYLDHAMVEDITRHLRAALAPGGYLFLGPAESLQRLNDEFKLLDANGTPIYTREPSSTPVAPRKNMGVGKEPGI